MSKIQMNINKHKKIDEDYCHRGQETAHYLAVFELFVECINLQLQLKCQYLSHHIDNRVQIVNVYTDFSKAFDHSTRYTDY